jgi:hypothetical protein
MNNHTPGQWKRIGETAIYGDDSQCIAVTESRTWIYNRDIDTAAANARLIAAAPDLLAALEALTAWAQTVPTDLAEDRLQANARAAIARATGDSQ